MWEKNILPLIRIILEILVILKKTNIKITKLFENDLAKKIMIKKINFIKFKRKNFLNI